MCAGVSGRSMRRLLRSARERRSYLLSMRSSFRASRLRTVGCCASAIQGSREVDWARLYPGGPHIAKRRHVPGRSKHPAPDVSAYRRNADLLRLLLDLNCAVCHERHDRAQRCPYWNQRSAHDADEERELNDGMAIWMLDDDAAHAPFVDESLDLGHQPIRRSGESARWMSRYRGLTFAGSSRFLQLCLLRRSSRLAGLWRCQRKHSPVSRWRSDVTVGPHAVEAVSRHALSRWPWRWSVRRASKVVNTRRCEGTREAPSQTGPKLSARRTGTSLCLDRGVV